MADDTVERLRQRVIDLMADALGEDAADYSDTGIAALDALIAAVRAECYNRDSEGDPPVDDVTTAIERDQRSGTADWDKER